MPAGQARQDGGYHRRRSQRRFRSRGHRLLHRGGAWAGGLGELGGVGIGGTATARTSRVRAPVGRHRHGHCRAGSRRAFALGDAAKAAHPLPSVVADACGFAGRGRVGCPVLRRQINRRSREFNAHSS